MSDTRNYVSPEQIAQARQVGTLDYLQRYDRIRAEMRMIVDMPEKSANRFISFVQQNGGKLSKARREWFSELTDEEITRLEEAVRNNTAPNEGELTSGGKP